MLALDKVFVFHQACAEAPTISLYVLNKLYERDRKHETVVLEHGASPSVPFLSLCPPPAGAASVRAQTSGRRRPAARDAM